MEDCDEESGEMEQQRVLLLVRPCGQHPGYTGMSKGKQISLRSDTTLFLYLCRRLFRVLVPLETLHLL